jgi:hypothetical protein
MGKNLTIGAIVAIVAAVGAMGGLTSVSFLQQAEAAGCQTFQEGGTTVKQKCSSNNSFENANAYNFNVHLKGLKN